MIAQISNEAVIRQQLQQVKNNTNLTEQEFALRCQSILTKKPSETEEEKNRPKSNESLTCKHYNKNCSRFSFDCCGIIDPCHRCHYARETCDKRPPQISSVRCNVCHTTQPPSPSCVNCDVQFSKSYCEKCKIWTALEIVHCDECGFCRVGKKEDIFHCKTCDACFPVAGRESHRCAKVQLKDTNCPLCLESVHTAQKSSTILPCGHVLHGDCWKEASSKGEYRCPTCRKSLLNMSNIWADISRSIELQPIPERFFAIQEGDVVKSPFGPFKVVRKLEESANEEKNQLFEGMILNWILANGKCATATFAQNSLDKKRFKLVWCYDCEKKSETPFHFLGLKCQNCNGYNTCQL